MISTIDNVTLIGTAHVSKESANLVKKTVLEVNPEIVAIELDKQRLHSLLEKQKHPNKKQNSSFFDRNLIRQVGMFGFYS